jgi:glucokinase
MAMDPQFVVVGSLMDPGTRTEAVRERYLRVVRETATPHLWPAQRARMSNVPATLAHLSQATGTALVALYQGRS